MEQLRQYYSSKLEGSLTEEQSDEILKLAISLGACITATNAYAAQTGLTF